MTPVDRAAASVLLFGTALFAVTAAAPPARARAPNPQLVVNGVTTTVGDAMNAAFGRRMVTASGVTVTIPQLQSGASTGFDQFTGPDAVVIGGAALPDQPPGMPVGDPALPSALDVIGAPYGSYNAGCVLCVFTSPQQITSDRAGIDGIDYRQGAGVIPQLGGNDAVGFYEQVENLPARFVLDVDHYTSGAVYLKTPLTAEQMSLLRTNMYLVTNSVDPTVSTSTATADGLPLVNLMEGFVSGWDPNGTFISVAGWAAATGGNGASGQVPNTGTLDTYWSNYGIPVVWVGAPTKMFGRNLYMAYNGAASEGQSTSLIRHFEGEEMDFRYTAASPGEVSFHGITISPAPLGGIGPAALGSGSYELYLAGAMPDHLLIDSGPYDREIRGNGFMSFGDGGATSAFTNPEMFEHDGYVDGANRLRLVGSLTKASSTVGWTSTSLGLGLTVDGTPGSPSSGTYEGGIVWNGGAANVGGLALCGGSGTCGVSVAANGTLRLGENEGGLRTVTGLTDDNVGSTVVAGEFDTYSDSNQNRLMTWTRRDSAAGGWPSVSIHLGLQIDGDRGTTDGAPMAQVVWNGVGDSGGVQLCGSGGTCGVSVRADGTTVAAILTFATLPTSEPTGSHAFCSDCKSSNGTSHHAGIPVWWSGAGWTDALGDVVTH